MVCLPKADDHPMDKSGYPIFRPHQTVFQHCCATKTSWGRFPQIFVGWLQPENVSQILHPDSPSSVFRLKLPHRDLSRSKCLSSPVGSEVWLVYHGLPSCTMNRKMHQCPRLFNCRGSILTNFPGSTSVQKSNSCSPKAAPRHIQVVVHNVPGKNVKKL